MIPQVADAKITASRGEADPQSSSMLRLPSVLIRKGKPLGSPRKRPPREIQRSGESESARVSAARTILEQALKAADLEDVQQRLDALEQAVKSQPERRP